MPIVQVVVDINIANKPTPNITNNPIYNLYNGDKEVGQVSIHMDHRPAWVKVKITKIWRCIPANFIGREYGGKAIEEARTKMQEDIVNFLSCMSAD